MLDGSTLVEGSCSGKQAHNRTMALKLSRRYPLAEAYRCKICGNWHLGRRDNPRPRKAKAVR